MKEEKYLSTTDVAKLLGISRVAVFKKIKSGEIKAAKVGRNFVIEKKELPSILGEILSQDKRRDVEEAVNRVIGEYGETLRLLGQE